MNKSKAIIDFLIEANEKGMSIFLEDGKLKYTVDKSRPIDNDFLARLKERKDEIIEFLGSESGDFRSYNSSEKKITPYDRSEPGRIPLSFNQERMWFVDKMTGSVKYHLPSVLRLKGKLNIEALDHALNTIVNRHEVLRTVIIEVEGKGYQSVKDKDLKKLKLIDGSIYKDNTEELQYYIRELINEPFDLSNDLMIRGHLIKLSEEDHVLVITMHHIASDGWSLSIIVRELVELYSAFEENREAQLNELEIQYIDYSIWQKNILQGESLDKRLGYWKNKLEGVEPLQMPTDFARPPVQSSRGAISRFYIEKETAASLQALSQKNGATMFMTLLSAFNILLYKYSGQEDICIGCPVAGRQFEEVESLIGFFINTLAIRAEVKGEVPFTEILGQVKQTTLEAFEYQDVPFEKIVDSVVKDRDLSRTPLYQVTFVLQNTPDIPELKLGEISLSSEDIQYNISKFDMVFSITETAKGLQGVIEYCTDLYKESTILRFIDHFKELLVSIIKDPEQKIDQLSLVTEAEENKLLVDFNNTEAEYPKDKNIIDIFEEQAAKTPENVAAVFQSKEISYRELNERANRIANYLISKGVKADTLVPVYIDRSLEMITGILGILKSGAAYVPVDTEYPLERISYMIQDTGAKIIVSCKENESGLKNLDGVEIISVDGDIEEISKQSSENLSAGIKPGHLAYVIYTSGSTGQPKGVMIEHRSLYSYLQNSKTDYVSNEEGSSGSFIHLSYTFDASVTGMFMPLLNGRSIVIGSKKSYEVFEDSDLQKYAPYDFIKITPSHLELLYPKMRTSDGRLLTKKLILGGEALHKSQLNNYAEDGLDVEIINEYGPTEATVGCSTYSINTSDNLENIDNNISIGKPIDNVRMYILDEQIKLAPIGIAGELCIGGDGLARGYLNQDELTKEKFINDPFSNKEGARLYKTGDMVRYDEDGNIEFIGRKDNQVKIRGHRIELEEIENAILENGSVKNTVVLAKENSEGNKRLIAYAVPNENFDFDKDKIVGYLNAKLPEYMVPLQWIEMENFPLNTSGKIDKKAFPDPDKTEQSGGEFEEARNDFEKVLAEIWQDLLEVDKVGIHDNFFELGGDSIVVIQLVSRARQEGFEFKVADVFAHQTIAKLSAVISQSEESSSDTSNEQGLLEGPAGLLPIQHWYFDLAGESTSHYNQSILLSVDKKIDPEVLNRAIEKLTEQHDSLRFIYHKKDGQWGQEYGENKGKLITLDLKSAEKDTLGKLITENANTYQKSFDIEKGDLARFVLIQTPESEAKNRLLMVIHHLVMDGVSWRILLADLEKLITELKNGAEPELGNKSSSYRQWYDALAEYGQSKKALTQIPYWEKAVKSYEPLPVDRLYEDIVREKDMASHPMRLDPVKTQLLLQEVPKVYHTEINDILMCALAMTLCEYGDKERINIGLEGHGRENISESIDTSRTVGWFTSLYPVLLEIAKGSDAGDKIKAVKEQLRQIPDKGLGFGVLKYINKEEKLSGHPAWDIVFNYLGQVDNIVGGGKWLSGAGESAGVFTSEENAVGENIGIIGVVQGGELNLSWSYSSRHYDKETIEGIAEKYKSNLELLIAHCQEQIKTGAVYTPSDYGLGSEIGIEELDKFLNEPFNGQPRSKSVEGLYRLSGLQEGMLFHALYDSAAGAYTEQLSCILKGADLDFVSRSWNHILKRHSILRSGFYFNELSIPVQCVYKKVELPVTILDYSQMGEKEQVIALEEFEEQDRQQGFDFDSVPLMRIILIRLNQDDYKMIWTSHHMLYDGWSLPVLMEEFLNTYEKYATGQQLPDFEEDKYEDYIRYIERIDKGEQEAYWREYMDGVEEGTLLPFIETTISRTKGVGEYESVHLRIDQEATSRAEVYAQKKHITINTLIQGVWSYLLHKYTGNSDVVFGTIVSGRPEDLPGIEQRVGMYINSLPLHSTLSKESGIAKWLQNIQKAQVSSRQYQYTPLQDIQKWTGVTGDLFDSLLVFENYPISEVLGHKEWKLKVEDIRVVEQTNYPLNILANSAREININFSYNSGILKREYVEEIKVHFENVLMNLINNRSDSLNEIEMLSKIEKHKILVDFNNTSTENPKDKTIIDIFEEQAAKTPDNIAAVFLNEELTYRELNERANQLANYLRSKGVKSDTLVPVCTDPGLEMIIGIFGILKSGAAYVPIDTEYPEDRINYILQDTKAKLLVSSVKNISGLNVPEDIEIISVDGDKEEISKQSSENVSAGIKPEDLVYIIYTSGSTGQPKGVMIEHRNLYGYFENRKTKFGGDEEGNSGSFIHQSYTFDGSLPAMFMPLLNGRSIVIGSKKSFEVFDDDNLEKYAPYDFIKITPSHLDLLYPKMKTSDGKQLTKKLILGGEALYRSQLNNYIEDKLELEIINQYGPTETTVGCSIYGFKIPDDLDTVGNIISIGQPIDNVKLYILGEHNELLPIGIAGELCIGGAGLARGYLNRPELTEEKFIKDPFSKKPGSRLYKTGDMARILSNGNVEFLGRKDNQVKIRGHRVELEEIESVILENESVKNAVVLAKETTEGNKRLVAYAVPDGKFDKEKIVQYLNSKLPEYMIPLQWVEMESFPLTTNGKVNKKALPDPEASDLVSNEYVAPRNELEIKLAEIWKTLLHADRVGIHDNFFELGGDSIITIQVMSRARRAGFELKPKDIFIHQTISNLSAVIAERTASADTGEQGILTGKCGLLPIQQSYFEGAEENISHFNQSVLLSIDKSVSQTTLSKAVELLNSHHDALRFDYQNKNGQWEQEYGVKAGELITVDLKNTPGEKLGEEIFKHADKYQKSLDIEKGDLAKFVLIETPESEKSNRLFIVIHHLAVDGVSWRILLDDLELLITELQNGASPDLGSKSSSYRQWYDALDKYGKSRRLLSQKTYWEKTADNYKPLFTDKEYEGKVKAKDFEIFSTKLDPAKTQLLLKQVPKVYHTEINDLLLCALALTLCEKGEMEKVIIGLEGHGRESISDTIDTSRTVGWFTSKYPVLLELSHDRNIPDSIKTVKEQLRQVPDKGLGYGVLKYLNKDKKIADGHGWDIIFNYLGQLDNVVSSGKWLSGAGESGGAETNADHTLSYKLSVNSMVQGGELILNWGFSKCHYEKKTVEELSERFKTTLESLIDHCIEQEKSGSVFTPSDYGMGSEISYAELDKFMEESFLGKPRRESVEGLYPLSGLQKGMLFHALFDTKAGAYTEQFSCDFIEPDIEVIKKSWSHVLNRHSILRSGFYHQEFSVPVQCVYRDIELPITSLDYSEMSPEDRIKALKDFEEADRSKGFDVKSVPLMRIALIRLSKDRYKMVWTYHHILFDGWSMSIVIGDFLTAYEHLVKGEAVPEAEEDKYEDYIHYLEREDKEEQEDYWRGYLKELEHNSLLPFIGATSSRTKGIGNYESVHLILNKETSAKTASFVQNHHLTINTLMQGIWSYLLHKYTGSDDVVYGVIVSGRPEDLPGVEHRVGLYINTLPLYTKIKKDKSISSWLQELQNEQISSRQHQYTPLPEIQRWSGVSGDMFDSLLVFENYPISEVIGSMEWSLKAENLKMIEQNNFPLTLLINSGETLSIEFNFNTNLLDPVYVKEISGHFEKVLEQIITSEAGKIKEIGLLTEPEEKQLLEEFNDTAVEYYKEDKTLVDLFEDQVMKTPDNTAVVFEEEKLTYIQLDERANQLAHYLREKGIKEESLVPICLERSLEMIIGILGIMKAGGAYVPVDPEYPEERIRYMLEDTGAGIILSNKENRAKLPVSEDFEIISLDEDIDLIKKKPADKLQIDLKANNLAYAIYTSGSTGQPKGAMNEHAGIVNRLAWAQDYFRLTSDDSVLQKTTFCFDVSVWELIWPLLAGSKLVFAKPGGEKDTWYLRSVIEKENITMLHFVPSMLELFLTELEPGECKGLKKVLCSGEALKPAHAELFIKKLPEAELHNLYGPTEAAIDVTYWSLKDKDEEIEIIPIGKPVSNTAMYVLDSNDELVPVGCTGQLHIGGIQVGRGYLNRPELTQEKFVKDHFSKDPDARLYRTGDLGRWMPDGNIEYLGRMDDQVKVRGFRIELGEIESVLQECGSVRQSVVMARESKDRVKRLVGYVVPEGKFDKESITEYLGSKLPDYMVPALWVELDKLPLTANGKINRKALPDPDASELVSNEYVEPRNESEEKAAEIWKEILKVDRVGINDNFFELGGDSIRVISVVHKLRKHFDKDIQVFDIYRAGTIAELIPLIDECSGIATGISEDLTAVEEEVAQLKNSLLPALDDQDNVEDIFPMSDIQVGMVFASLLNPEQGIYHDQFLYPLSEKIDQKVFEKALQLMVKKHSTLRTAFNMDAHSEGVQVVYKNVPVKVDSIELEYTTDLKVREYIKEYLTEELKKPFDINKAPLWRATLLFVNGHTVFIFQFHHSILDGWSVASLITELNNVYLNLLAKPEDVSVTDLKCTYKDYVVESLADKKNDKNKNFWVNEMSDYKRLDIFSQVETEKKLNKIYSKDFLYSLIRRTKEDGISLKTLFFGAYLYILSLLTYEDEVTAGLVTSNRPVKEDGEKVLGCFLNTVPFRFKEGENSMTWKTYFDEVEKKVREVSKRDRTTLYEIAKMTGEVSPNGNPFFDVLFNFVNFHVYEDLDQGLSEFGKNGDAAEQKELVTNEDETYSHELANTFLDFSTRITGDLFNIDFKLRRELKSGKKLEDLLGYFESVITCYLEKYNEQLDKKDVIPADEIERMLVEYNDNAADYPKNRSLADLFEEQVEKTPDNIALVFEDQELTYSELNMRSNQLAHYLLSKEVKPQTLIPLCLERGPDMITGMLGILKAGCAYVPVDADYPEDRIKFMLKDTEATLILSSDENISKLPEPDKYKIISIDKERDSISKQPSDNPEIKPAADHLAYVIYTSGSTGNPKGVMIEHGSVVNLIKAQTAYFNISSDERILQFSNYSFDASVEQIFLALFNGASLVLIPEGLQLNTEEFENFLKEKKISHLHATPSFLDNLNPSGQDSLKRVIAGGDICKRELAEKWKDKTNFYNEYGPTETTVTATEYFVGAENSDSTGSLPIGKALSNIKAYILDKNETILPAGVEGELCLAGDCLARGYLNNPELTDLNFVKDPFSNKEVSKMYKTGDLTRWLTGGNIEFIGRIDDQVKIRGYRIELGEIESVLLKSGLAEQAVVLARAGIEGDKRLVGYIVTSGEFDYDKVVSYLKSKLPEYMVPALWVELESLPLTPNGKIDKNALPDPDVTERLSKQYEAPRNETEEKLAAIWTELLGVEKVGIRDNFFELGGHSLLATRAVSKIRKEFSLNISIRTLFEFTCIADLADYIEFINTDQKEKIDSEVFDL